MDTSILIGALTGPQGASREVIRRCLTGLYTPLVSNALFSEYQAVASRQRIQQLCPLKPEEIRQLLHAFYSVCQWVPIYYLWRPNLPDETDNFLVELALAGNARVLVTRNLRDLKAAELKFPALQVLGPEDLIR